MEVGRSKQEERERKSLLLQPNGRKKHASAGKFLHLLKVLCTLFFLNRDELYAKASPKKWIS